MSKSKTAAAAEDKFENTEFDLFRALEAIDRKDYDYYSRLTDEQRKRFVPYMMLQWVSSIKGSSDLTAYYVMSTELAANKHCFNEAVYAHPELQWKMLCAASPGMGKQFHSYIPQLSQRIGKLQESVKKKELVDYLKKIYKNDSADDIDSVAESLCSVLNTRVRLAEHCPELKLDDIAVLSQCVSAEDIALYEEENGIV